MNRLDEWLKERARREDCPVPQGFDGRMDAILEGLPDGRRMRAIPSKRMFAIDIFSPRGVKEEKR